MKLFKFILVRLVVTPIFYIMTFPICGIIALMDWNNGRSFKENLREVMGVTKK
tara:strand:- start:205 stop:363 length:159 start_codon:yes stop_codon:yes gene_type:complete